MSTDLLVSNPTRFQLLSLDGAGYLEHLLRAVLPMIEEDAGIKSRQDDRDGRLEPGDLSIFAPLCRQTAGQAAR